MTETAYAPGTPIWVDLGSPDLEGSKAFYSGVFGWDPFTVPDPAAGGYTFFLKDKKMVGALGGLMSADQPPAWSTYISTDDAAATAEKVREAGGQVIVPPFDVMGQGTMGVFADPTGAVFSVWQPGIHRGAEVVNEPGSFCWNELATPDMDAARRFYGHVFGWESKSNPMPDGGEYVEWQVDGRSVAGGMVMTGRIPEGIPPHWLTYFAVEDLDDTVKRVRELGGNATDPMQTEMGPFAIITDPQGAAFAIMQIQG